MGAKIQAFDIFQTPLSSHYPLPLTCGADKVYLLYSAVEWVEMFSSIIRTLLQSETGRKNWTEIYPHCNENSNYVSPENELRGLSPNFHIHVSVGDLYTVFPGLVHTFSCSRIGRPIMGEYKSLTETWRWQLGLRPHNSFSGNICFEFSVLCLCSAAPSG
jgi:hypothetical protein